MAERSIAVDRERLEHAAAVAEERVRAGSHPCAVLAVADSRETLWTRVVPGETKAHEDTIFLLASITKPITATAVMQLVEEGELLLDRPVSAYLPEFGAHGKEGVTARHLLTHTSGLDELVWMEKRIVEDSNVRSYEMACAAHLRFQPGTRCEYCSLSFDVLAELITHLGGQPYPEYLQHHVLAPAGMADTAFRPADTLRAARVYDFPGPEGLDKFIWRAVAGGGLWSTAADLVAFGQTFLCRGRGRRGRVLGPAAVEAMTRDLTGELALRSSGFAAPFHYGLGWGKRPAYDSNLGSPGGYGHGGATGTLLWVDPAWDLVFVFLTNRWGVEQDTPARALNAVYGAIQEA